MIVHVAAAVPHVVVDMPVPSSHAAVMAEGMAAVIWAVPAPRATGAATDTATGAATRSSKRIAIRVAN